MEHAEIWQNPTEVKMGMSKEKPKTHCSTSTFRFHPATVVKSYRSIFKFFNPECGARVTVSLWAWVEGVLAPRFGCQKDSALCQKWAKREGFVAFPKAMASVGHLTRILKDTCRIAGAAQETCSSEMLWGQGANFFRGVTFWNIRSSVLER